ncbi:MAG: feruloyl esterase [Labilithrix sp.]|nr:feruloyl esterase [Labilithrix sp.]
MQTRRLWGDVLIALCASPLLAACASNPGSTEDSIARVCPPKTTKATLPGAGGGGALTPVAAFGANPAGLNMYVHAPASGKANAIVVAMHGCTQTASAYVAAGWNDVADAAGFVVVYPEQTSKNNGSQCFRWWDAANTTRDKGEARSIASMVAYAKTTYGATHAYVTGLSAGAAMTAVMLATYPDVFEAGAIMAGLPYACATTQNDAYACMSGKDKTPAQWGALVPKLGAAKPRVAIWQGNADYTVRPTNLAQLVRQWTDVNGISDKPAATSKVGKAQHDEFRDAQGVTRVESWLIEGMAHGVSVDPTAGCGTAGAFVLDEGLCSTKKAAEFFGLVAASGSPSGGAGSGGATPGGGGAGSPGGGGASSGGAAATPGDCDP